MNEDDRESLERSKILFALLKQQGLIVWNCPTTGEYVLGPLETQTLPSEIPLGICTSFEKFAAQHCDGSVGVATVDISAPQGSSHCPSGQSASTPGPT